MAAVAAWRAKGGSGDGEDNKSREVREYNDSNIEGVDKWEGKRHVDV